MFIFLTLLKETFDQKEVTLRIGFPQFGNPAGF